MYPYKKYFEAQLTLIQQEFDADKLQFKTLFDKSTTQEKRAMGWCWYPLSITSTETLKGDYLLIHAERTSHKDLNTAIKAGSPISFFSQHDKEAFNIEGIAHYVKDNQIGIKIPSDDLPEWVRGGKLGVELLFDSYTYKIMFETLQYIKNIEFPVNLIDILIGNKKPTFGQILKEVSSVDKKLNPYQLKAIEKILQAEQLAVVHGPPGTGKTTTLVCAIEVLIRQQPNTKILVTAASNTAVDVMALRLSSAGISVVRIGQSPKIDQSVEHLTLDHKLQMHEQYEDTKKLRKQAQEYIRMAHTYKRNFGKTEKEQRKLMFDEAHKIYKEIDAIESYCTQDIVHRAQVITATLVSSALPVIKNQVFDIVFIDEAGQALEAACWIPILKAKKIVFAGDHLQLPPTIKATGEVQKKLETTLMQKVITMHPESVVLLQEQYRMHQAISAFSSSYFYKNALQAHPSVATHTLPLDEVPIEFVDTAGCGYTEVVEGTAISNPEEVQFVMHYLRIKYPTWFHTNLSSQSLPSLGIISPYRMQVLQLKESLEEVEIPSRIKANIHVQTIDGFQGQERDIIILSLVRSNTEGVIGFLHDYRRINVAMTRAKKKLVIIGDGSTLGTIPFYDKLIQHISKNGLYVSAWEYIHL